MTDLKCHNHPATKILNESRGTSIQFCVKYYNNIMSSIDDSNFSLNDDTF